MDRQEQIARLRGTTFEVVVIGGGATGLGIALDAASRGYRVALFEKGDFAQGTSSRSTKLIHGGVRYLKQGNFSLVREALRERSTLLRIGSPLVCERSFVIPTYHLGELGMYGLGLKLYDCLAVGSALPRSRILSREETLRRIPSLRMERLRGGVEYFDAQFDDARYAIALARRALHHGAVILNYMPVTSFLRSGGRVCGVHVRDDESKTEYEVQAGVVINATGVFTQAVERLDNPQGVSPLRYSQGSHLVLDREFLPGESALMVPKTKDGRVIFALPWHGRIVVGTTDREISEPVAEPRITEEEIEFLLSTVGQYLARLPSRNDIRSTFVGIRPLLTGRGHTSQLSREHSIRVSESGLVTISGGKWTTYRRMAEECLAFAKLSRKQCITERENLLSDPTAEDLPGSECSLEQLPHLVPRFVKDEMARTVEDVLSRRTRLLLLDARQAHAVAPKVAQRLADVLGRDESWRDDQIRHFQSLAESALPGGV